MEYRTLLFLIELKSAHVGTPPVEAIRRGLVAVIEDGFANGTLSPYGDDTLFSGVFKVLTQERLCIPWVTSAPDPPSNPAVIGSEPSSRPSTRADDNQKPWEMTREAFVTWAAANHPKKTTRSAAGSGEALMKGTKAYQVLDAERCSRVEAAIMAGEEVPEAILAEYPDLDFWKVLGR